MKTAKTNLTKPSWRVTDNEPVIQESPWNEDSVRPLYGDSELWDLGGLGGPTNGKQQWGRLHFKGLPYEWNALARQVVFCMLNPGHVVLRRVEIHVRDVAYSPATLRKVITTVRSLAEYAELTALPCDFTRWTRHHFQSWYNGLTTAFARRRAVELHEKLLTYGPVLFAGTPHERVWTPEQQRSKSPKSDGNLKTKPIQPKAFMAVLNAALNYVEVFAPDVLKALENRDRFFAQALDPGRKEAYTQEELMNWLADPANRIPLHSPTKTEVGKSSTATYSLEKTINFRMLSLMIWGRNGGFALRENNSTRQKLRDLAVEAVAAGRGSIGGLGVECKRINGRPWHDDFSPRTAGIQAGHLRSACYIVVAAMSLMRDSEVQEIKRDSVVDHHGAPALRSVLWKNRPDAPVQHWWIHPVAVSAVEVAEKLSLDEDFVFSATTKTATLAGFHAAAGIDRFVSFVNAHGERMGLERIDDKIRPHKFRRTMAIVIGQQPGAELAMGLILKHASTRAVANALSRGYSRPDEAWAKRYETDRAEAAAGRHIDEWLAFPERSRAVAGPGAATFNEVFDQVQETALSGPIIGDKSDLRALLLQKHPNFRAGPVNFCLGDASKAACLSSLTKRPVHGGVDPLNCTPGVCAQSAVTSVQMPIWTAEERDLKRMLKQRGISDASEQTLRRRLSEVERITKPSGTRRDRKDAD